ncbi:Proton pump interactor 1 isoform 2 [Hibiscus syriacus]|uniref:Proton pump interactor 1 isoform 2 n=1 Tax=Hibiscus syriacus TaxID=106335 RepID=A0A6A3ADX1_HIBSY|nr:Proton pump interactor 1 isoform 2 [Hibiscus syriacus]
MGVEVVGSEMAKVPVDKATEVDKSLLHDKENGKLDNDPVHTEPIKVGSDVEEPNKGEEKNVSDFPIDAVTEWPAPKQIHSFYFIRYSPFDDPKKKAKIDQVDKEMQKLNKVRFQLTDELKSHKSDRAELLSQVKALNVDFEQFKTMLGEKKKEMEPLQQALGKLHNNNIGGGRGGICSSEEELNDIIYSLQYRIQHESIPLSEEKQLLREIKQLEGTRDKVIANAAVRSKIQESLGQKEGIQDQVKLMGNDLDGVRKEQNAIWSKKKQIKEKVSAIESKVDSLQQELNAVIQKRNKAYETMQQLWKQRDEANVHFYQSRSLLNKAKELAAKKDIKGLEELSTVERQLSRDGRIRNPDEKPLVVQEAPVASAPETIPKPSVRQPKEEAKPSEPDTKLPKKSKKISETKVIESKSPPENGVVEEKEISGSGNLQKVAEKTSADKEIDAAKLKEMKREEEIAKAKQAMERKKKKAEEKAAKAAIRAQKEAEKKLKEIISFFHHEQEKKAKKKAAASSTGANHEEPTEAVAEAPEPEKEENADAPAPVAVKDKVQKENTVRHRNRTKSRDSLPRPILKRKKSTNYWMWAAPAAVVVLILIALGYYYLA